MMPSYDVRFCCSVPVGVRDQFVQSARVLRDGDPDGILIRRMVVEDRINAAHIHHRLHLAAELGILVHSVEVVMDTDSLAPDFRADVTTGPAPLRVSFRDMSRTTDPNGVRWREWDFGDQVERPERYHQNPTVTYEKPGRYTVRMIALDTVHPFGMAEKVGYITVT